MAVEAWTPMAAEENDHYWSVFYFGLHPGTSDPLGRIAADEPTIGCLGCLAGMGRR